MTRGRWEFWIDVGGTFTDCIGRRPDGQLVRHKTLSSGAVKGCVGDRSSPTVIHDPLRAGDPDGFWEGCRLQLLDEQGRAAAAGEVAGFDRSAAALRLDRPLAVAPQAGQAYELQSDVEAPLIAVRYLLGLRPHEPIPPVSVRLGTTRGTNALLTRRGAPTALVTTRGFGDVLRIGYQNRPRLFDLTIRKPPPLGSWVVEIDERVTAAGEVLRAPDEEQVRRQLSDLAACGARSLAICLLHAHAWPRHEQLVERIAREIGFDEISCSSRIAPLIKIVSRGDTTVVDAYLNPVLRDYVQRLRSRLDASGRSPLRVLTSAGGLIDAGEFVGKDSILSGPAGGVVGYSRVARSAGFARAIGLDMGGTSTDVSRFDGRYDLEHETEKAGVRIVAPMMAIETVAAGGGSVCRFDGAKLVVGPDSAGADPGPACYGRGGPLAVTDMNLYLGRLASDRFPFPLDRRAVERRLRGLCQQVAVATGRAYPPEELADGFLRVANSHMVHAIRSISIARGADPRDYVLVAFGGAAPQHACAVARELEMRQILIHPDAGLLSALGIGLADVTRHRSEGVYGRYSREAVAGLEPRLRQLEEQARAEVLAEGFAPAQVEVRRALQLRYAGLEATLTIPASSAWSYEEGYRQEHQRLYGYLQGDRPLEIVAAQVEVIGRASTELPPAVRAAPRAPCPTAHTTAWFAGRPLTAHLFSRAQLQPGDVLDGPAIVVEAAATTIVDPGWRAEVLSDGQLLLSDQEGLSRRPLSTKADPVTLEVFNNHFAAIAGQMGITLRNTASSVNVKERLDFSCAIFTAAGDLVVNAPHVPVHLGAMAETVRQLVADHPAMRAGDVWVTNDPYAGGSHLPDVTVVTPVHDPASGRLVFLTASRAHHAEIGGIVPGSMPPFSTNLAEEGVLIRSFQVVEAGQSRLEQLRQLLLAGPHPTRNVHDNLADVTAQIAANRQGAQALWQLVERYGLAGVEAYMRHIQDAAERKTRAALSALPDGRHVYQDHLDDGWPIVAACTIRGDRATIDFTGTAPVLAGNLNANRAIVTAAVLYCLRCLIAEEIPLNQGVLAPVELVVPECLLNPPRRASPAACAAVAGGNVETSQRIVDVLLGALGVAAASQGTMNNLVFGDAMFGYYETICGGAGATAEADGADAVHTHMTNTRLTDVEVLESRYPVRVLEFSIRRGSGGNGRHRGGDGVVRKLEFLRPLEVSILSQRRGAYLPYGLAGGWPGAAGRNLLQRADGRVERLGGIAQFSALPGDILTIETPGGGGYGQPARDVAHGTERDL